MSGQRLSRGEVCLCLLLAVTVSLGIGLHGRFAHLRVNWDGLAAVAHAYDVFHAEPRANLAMIGFVQPPLPALLQLPIVLVVPWLATSGVASNLLGALCLGAASALLLGLAAEAGLDRPWRWGLVMAWLLHPMVLGPATTGSPMALLMALLMGTAWALLRWSRTEGLRELVAASLLLSGALITRYEAIFIVAGAVIYLAWRTLRSSGSWSKLEGTLITFGLPIAYVAGIWISANWAIMGDPWHFARETFSNPRGPDGERLSFALVQVSLVCFFPIFALVYHQVRGAGRTPAPARPLAWLVLTAMLGPLIFPGVFGKLSAPDEWGRLVTLVAMVLVGGYAMLAVAVGTHRRGKTLGGPAAGSLLIAVISTGLLGWLLSNGLGLPGRATDAYVGRGPMADWAGDELLAARRLIQTDLPEGPRHVVAGWPGFAVVLFGGKTGQIQVVLERDCPAELPRLSRGSRLIKLPERGHGLRGRDVGAVPPGLSEGLELRPRWQQGSWLCYEVVEQPGTVNRQPSIGNGKHG